MVVDVLKPAHSRKMLEEKLNVPSISSTGKFKISIKGTGYSWRRVTDSTMLNITNEFL